MICEFPNVLDVKPIRPDRRRHKRKINRKWLLTAVVLFGSGLLAAGAMTVYRAQRVVAINPSVPEEIQVSQQLVRQNIRDEFRSSFAPVEETVLENLPNDKLRVSGWVDLVTDAGISDRQNYSIVIYRNAAGDWVGENISILPQM